MINEIQSPNPSAANTGGTMDNLASAANVIEEIAGRGLTLNEWQKLDILLEEGHSEPKAIKMVLEMCAEASPEELVLASSMDDQPLAAALDLDDCGKSGDPLAIEGRALIVGEATGATQALRDDLATLGLEIHMMEDTRNLQSPIPGLIGLPVPVNFIFVAESCGQGMGPSFCDSLLALGVEDHCAIILVDEGLDLMEDWDDWPVSGVLSMSAGITEIQAILKDLS